MEELNEDNACLLTPVDRDSLIGWGLIAAEDYTNDFRYNFIVQIFDAFTIPYVQRASRVLFEIVNVICVFINVHNTCYEYHSFIVYYVLNVSLPRVRFAIGISWSTSPWNIYCLFRYSFFLLLLLFSLLTHFLLLFTKFSWSFTFPKNTIHFSRFHKWNENV